jgi:hypothetical protein
LKKIWFFGKNKLGRRGRGQGFSNIFTNNII